MKDGPALFGDPMKRFAEGIDRSQITLCPERRDDWSDDDPSLSSAFVNALDLRALNCRGIMPEAITSHILLCVRCPKVDFDRNRSPEYS